MDTNATVKWLLKVFVNGRYLSKHLQDTELHTFGHISFYSWEVEACVFTLLMTGA